MTRALPAMIFVVRQSFAGIVLLCLSAAAAACPLCLGAGQQTKAQQLVAARQAVPTADASRFRVVEVIKGERPPSGTIEGGYLQQSPSAQAREFRAP